MEATHYLCGSLVKIVSSVVKVFLNTVPRPRPASGTGLGATRAGQEYRQLDLCLAVLRHYDTFYLVNVCDGHNRPSQRVFLYGSRLLFIISREQETK